MMLRTMARFLLGGLLFALAGVLYTRAGYGPFGDPAQRAKPCEVTRCAHNATVVLAAAIALLLNALRHNRSVQVKAIQLQPA